MDDDDRVETYLADPSAPPARDVQALEERLVPLRFEVSRLPLELPPEPAGAVHLANFHISKSGMLALVAAALVMLAVGLGAALSWRWSWTPGAPWATEVRSASGEGTSVRTSLAVAHPLRLPETSSARVSIARIGTMLVSPGSALTLTETTSMRHRVALDRGAVSVHIWAPPGMFAFETPSGTVRDLGCVFDLAVDAEGISHLHVDTGWVQMDNAFGESLVPAGATAVMRRVARPGVPIYDGASEVFAAAVRRAENGGDAAERRELDTILRTARRHDVLTLLMLANVASGEMKRALLTRAADLWPPPSGSSVEGIIAGDRNQLWRWHGALDVPPVKSWWRNWRDALPWRQ